MIKTTLSLFIICLVVSAALGFTYTGTKDTIAERSRLDAENARLEVLSGADKFEKVENIDSILKGKPDLEPVKEAYKALKSGAAAGYVFSTSSKGYGGEIKITVGIDKTGKITGVKIGDNTETPGLGSKAADQPFMSQLLNITPKEPLTVVKSNKSKPEQIDAISGATITSRAVVKAVQAAVGVSAELTREGGSSK